MARLELTIENGSNLSSPELRELLGIIDRELLSIILSEYRGIEFLEDVFPWPLRHSRYADGDELPFSFLEIETVRSGSIILTIVVTGIVTWMMKDIIRGAKRSPLGQELERTGRILGDIGADHLKPINDQLEEWSKNNRRLRDKSTNAKIRRLYRDGE